jgi:hypothetical protein
MAPVVAGGSDCEGGLGTGPAAVWGVALFCGRRCCAGVQAWEGASAGRDETVPRRVWTRALDYICRRLASGRIASGPQRARQKACFGRSAGAYGGQTGAAMRVWGGTRCDRRRISSDQSWAAELRRATPTPNQERSR